jgi:hypothetical protein
VAENQQLNVTIATHVDTSGVQQAQQALQQLTARQEFANRTLRLSMQSQGVPQTVQAFQAQVQAITRQFGAAPTLIPSDVGIKAGQAAQAAGQVASATRSANEEALRLAGAFVGITSVLDLAATAARGLQQQIGASIQAEVDLERAVRATNATFGQRTAAQLTAGAQRFTQNPDTTGTQADFLRAAQGMSALQGRLELTPDQIDQATTAAGKLANTFGTDLAPAAHAVQAALQGDTGALEPFGITLTDQYGRIQSVGQTYEQLATSTSRAHASQVLLRDILADVDKQQRTAASSTDTLAAALDRLGKSADAAHANLGKAISGPASGLATSLANLIEHPERLAEMVLTGNPAVGIGGQPSAAGGFLAEQARSRAVGVQPLPGGFGLDTRTNALLSQEEVNQRLSEAMDRQRQAAEDARTAEIGLADARAAEAKRAEELASALGARISGALLPVLQHLQAAQSGVSALGTVGTALQGVPGAPLSDAAAARLAEVRAAQQVLQRQAQQQTLASNDVQTAIQQARAASPTDFARAQTGAAAGIAAQQAGVEAQRAATEANAQLQRIQIAQDERRLAVADQITAAKRRELEVSGQLIAVNLAQRTLQAQATLASDRLQSIQITESNRRLEFAGQEADLRRESLQTQQQMAPLLLQQGNLQTSMAPLMRQQADLQERQTVAARDNLQVRRELIGAQQAALSSQGALGELNYEQQRLQLQAQVRQAALIRGQQPSGPSFADLSQQFREGELNRPGVELAALDAQQRINRAQQAAQADALGRAGTQADLEEQARALQDQLAPLQSAQRAIEAQLEPLQANAREEQARADALQRYLDLLDTQDAQAKASAQLQINLIDQQLIALNQTLVPLQLQAEAADAVTQAIQNQLALLDLAAEPAKAFWQTAVDYASTLKLDAESAARAASDYGTNLNTGTGPAEAIALSLERGQAALAQIASMSDALGANGLGVAGGGTGGVNVSGITVNVSGGGDPEAIVAEATRRFEVQFREALRSSGSAPPPITSSLAGARRG